MRSFDLSFRPAPRWRSRIRIGAGALDLLAREVAAEWSGRLVAVVADANVATLHAQGLAETLRTVGLDVRVLSFPAGESQKTRETAAALEQGLFDAGAGRDTLVIGVGGGVTCDLAGYLASVWHRGVPVVHAPTSLLAMVDAAIGGKTGFNLASAKNLIGTVHQPWGVYCDIATLETLPASDYVCGFAEVIKSAAIADMELFRRLERTSETLLRREEAALEQAVLRSVAIKGRIVTRDEREGGLRAMLNFGHTLAHAIETVTGYRVAHGAAVASGICLEARLAARIGDFPEAHVRRLEALVRAFGLPSGLPPGVAVDRVLDATRRDKKARGSRVRYALPTRLGRMPRTDPTLSVEDDDVRAVLDRAARDERG